MLQGDIPFEEDDDIAKAAPNFYRPISQGEGTMCAVLNVSRDHYCCAFSVRLYLTLCIVCIKTAQGTKYVAVVLTDRWS